MRTRTDSLVCLFARLIVGLSAICAPLGAFAGGPRYVAGTSYFNPVIAGQPLVWINGKIQYFLDQGDLSASVDRAAAASTVAAAAAAWNAVPTAAVSIMQGGSLAENVSGSNVTVTSSGLTIPADIQSTATSTPLGIVFDEDGSVIDAFYGEDASDPDDCIDFGVLPIVDNFSTNGNILHALILVNGRCAGTPAQLQQMQFQLMRAFGRVLGLDWSQANDAVLEAQGTPSFQQLEGWPLMRPIDLDCNQLSVECVPNAFQLRPDDIAALNRLYPVTSASAQSPGKILTSASTLSVHGTIRFRRGQGMQGVNVVARPITPGVGSPDDRYSVSSVSGFLFTGYRGALGTEADPPLQNTPQFGSLDPALEGFYDLTGIPLPPGQSAADFQITLEPINPLYNGDQSVGPYTLGSPTPSGTMPSIVLKGLSAGLSVEQDFVIADSAGDLQSGSGGSFTSPALLPPAGEWHTRIGSPGQTQWFVIPVQGGHHFTVEAQALNADSGTSPSDDPSNDPSSNTTPSENKLRPVLAIWDPSAASSSPPVVATAAPFNGAQAGVSALPVDTLGDGQLLLGISDQRGDGRPDYTFHGRLLYVSTVAPSRMPLTGGNIAISGSGFHPGMVLSLGSQIFPTITQITPTLILAVAPPMPAPTGSLDLIVSDPATNGIAAIAGGISYGDASTDVLSIVASPPTPQASGVPSPFIVRVFEPDRLTPVGGVPVTFSVLSGDASFSACPAASCTIQATGDGRATVSITAASSGLIHLRASLSNGNAVDSEFSASVQPTIAAITPPLFLAPGAAWLWNPQVQVWNGSIPAVGSSVNWSGVGLPSSTTITDAHGIATLSLSLGPWTAGTTAALSACMQGTASCVTFSIYTVHPGSESLVAVSGVGQQLATGQPPAPIVVRLIAPGSQPIVGGLIAFSGTVRSWAPPCAPVLLCGQGRLLSAFNLSLATGADGVATFLPPIATSSPQQITGLAVAASAAIVPFQLTIPP